MLQLEYIFITSMPDTPEVPKKKPTEESAPENASVAYDIVAKPSYSALKIDLKAGEKIRTESGAMLAASENISIEGSVEGGLWQAVKRTVLTSESFFVTEIEAKNGDAEVYLAPRSTGDIERIPVSEGGYIVQGGSFLAATGGVQTDTHFSGWKGFLSGEGIFMIKAEGSGDIFVSSFGGIIKKDLAAGEKYTVDNGHIVAFPASMPYEIRKAGDGLFNMVTTGEGLVSDFTGPGTIYLQSRNLRTFAEELNPFLRARERSQGGGLLGEVLGG